MRKALGFLLGGLSLGSALASPATCEPRAAPLTVAAPRATVGDGTPSSCHEAALREALSRASTIVFACGPEPATLTLSRTIDITGSGTTLIDGGHRVTLDGTGSVRLLSMARIGYRSNTDTLILQRLRLVNGRASGTGYVAPDPSNPRCAYGFRGGSGGAIEVKNAKLHVIDVTFENNAAASPGPDVGGGALHAAGSLGVTIVGSTFIGNHGANGGAAGFLQTDVRIVDSRFEGNRATGVDRNYAGTAVASCPGVGHRGQGGAGGNGGAVVVDGSHNVELTVCGSSFVGNVANEMAGGLFRTANHAPRPTLIERSSFVDNRAALAGAIFLMNAEPAEVAATRFVGNVAGGAGAAQFADSLLALRDSVFADNRATSGVGGALLLSGNVPASRISGVTFARSAAAFTRGPHGAVIFGADERVVIERSLRCDPAGAEATSPSRSVTPRSSGPCLVTPIEGVGR